MRKIILLLMFFSCAYAADTTGTWAAAATKTKMDSLENYTWDPAQPGSFSTDVILKYDGTSVVNTQASAGMAVKRVIKSAGYTGLWTFNPSSGIFSVVDGFIDSSASANSTNITKEFRMTGNGQFKSHRGAGAGVINPPTVLDFAFLGQYDTLNWRNTIYPYNIKCAQNATDTFRLIGNITLCPIFKTLNMGDGVFNIVNSQQVAIYCQGGDGNTVLPNATNTFIGAGSTVTIGPNVAGTWTIPKIKCVGGPIVFFEFLSTNAAQHLCTLNVTDTVGFRTIYINCDAAAKAKGTVNFQPTSVLSTGASYTIQVGNASIATPPAQLNVHWAGTVLDSGIFDGVTWNADTCKHYWDSGSIYLNKAFKLGSKSVCSAIKTNFIFQSANSCTLLTNNQTLGNVYIRKSKTTTIRTRFGTDFTCLDFVADSGKFYQDKKVFSARSITFNSTDTAKFDTTINISGDLTIAASAVSVFAAGIKFVLSSGATHTVTTGGKRLDSVFISGNTSIVTGDSIQPVISDSQTVTWQSGQTFVVLAGYDLNGSSGKLVRSISSSSGVRYNLNMASDTGKYRYIRDANCTNTMYLNSTAQTGGNNVNVKSLSVTGVTKDSTTGQAGGNIIFTSAGFVGGGCSIGDSILSLTVDSYTQATATVPSIAVGTYAVKVWNSDADTVAVGNYEVQSSAKRRNNWNLWFNFVW